MVIWIFPIGPTPLVALCDPAFCDCAMLAKQLHICVKGISAILFPALASHLPLTVHKQGKKLVLFPVAYHLRCPLPPSMEVFDLATMNLANF